MDRMTCDVLRSLIGARENFALTKLDNNLEYQSVCRNQGKSAETVEEQYQRFEKADRITIRRHYEGEIQKTNYQIKEAYIQGLRDCFCLISF